MLLAKLDEVEPVGRTDFAAPAELLEDGMKLGRPDDTEDEAECVGMTDFDPPADTEELEPAPAPLTVA